MSNQYVKFLAQPSGLSSVRRVVDAFMEEAAGSSSRTDEQWMSFFDQEALAHFWWPTESELQEWSRQWFDTHQSKRHLIPPTRWDFGSLIDAVRNNEWDLTGVRSLDDQTALIEFTSHSYPFGGTECLVTLVESFGNQVLEVDDGTGARPHIPVAVYWKR
jgi:hypothetical protein